jgi:hypothetical protein
MPTTPTLPGSSSSDLTGNPSTSILDAVSKPSDLKGKTVRELNQLALEIRDDLIANVTKTGGHLGASMGTVELAISLHYVFESPRDKIVWDVGHQAYAHKILTGRRDRFPTLRKEASTMRSAPVTPRPRFRRRSACQWRRRTKRRRASVDESWP